MYYYRLKRLLKRERTRAIEGLKTLRGQLDKEIPEKTASNHLLLATWNIRDLTKGKNRRFVESLHFIAEIISRFDILAIQEVNSLYEWDQIIAILGKHWDYISSDVTDRSIGGNGERLLYVFDTRKVSFQRVAGEIVLPPKLMISQSIEEEDGEVVIKRRQFARTPYVANFQAGWFKFSLCTVHIYYGDDAAIALERRRQEIASVAEYFSNRADEELKRDRALILLGDFNIYSKKHGTYDALKESDFIIPESLQSEPTNQSKTKYYDQIAFKSDQKVIDFIDKQCEDQKACNSGVLNFYKSIFRDERKYTKERRGSRSSFFTWRSYQMSDHLPMWVRIDINDSEEYLDDILEERAIS